MCGIVGQYRAVAPDRAERMLGRVAHRGPDDHGSVAVDASWLGHRRLSIVDLDGGAQPLRAADREAYFVGNGEIYNHLDVREALADTPFMTRSDNEAAFAATRQWGPMGLAALNGMFAFLLAADDGAFVAARDPVGIKPLYWARDDAGGITFASEIKAFDAEQRPAIQVFPPGHCWMPDRGLQRFGRPGGLKEVVAPPNTGGELTRAETVTAIRETLIRCVEGQMMGDVPVGVFLSGGLDSSLVAAIAARWARERGYTLHTFAVGLTGASDLQAARDVSRHLGTEHHEVVYTTDEALDALPEVIRSIEHFDPELVRSAVPNYLLAACAVRHVKVVLTGEGADELFAGYDYLTEIQDHHALQSELQRTVDGLHNLNLQRCDRVTMAHGLEARVPFLDPQMIALALSIPAAWKLHQPGTCEKQLVREAFDGWLPDGVLWRKKEQFGEGSGATALLRGRTRGEGHTEPTGNCEMTLRTAEEASYHRIWEDAYRGVRPGDTISRSVTV